MKTLFLFMICILACNTAFAGEVTGAGLTQILLRNNVDVSQFKQRGLNIIVKKPNVAKRLKLGKVKYYVGANDVFSARSVNRVEFKQNQANNFMWKNVESIEVNQQIVFPGEIKGFVIQK